jgi:hypothetical protein
VFKRQIIRLHTYHRLNRVSLRPHRDSNLVSIYCALGHYICSDSAEFKKLDIYNQTHCFIQDFMKKIVLVKTIFRQMSSIETVNFSNYSDFYKSVLLRLKVINGEVSIYKTVLLQKEILNCRTRYIHYKYETSNISEQEHFTVLLCILRKHPNVTTEN